MWDTHTRTVRNHYANHDQPTPHTNTHAHARALVACGIGKVGHKVCGGHSTGETPSNIPNLEAKPGNANGTAIDRSWESRTPPQHNHTKTTRPPPPLPARRPGWGAPAYPHPHTPHAHPEHTPTRARTHTPRAHNTSARTPTPHAQGAHTTTPRAHPEHAHAHTANPHHTHANARVPDSKKPHIRGSGAQQARGNTRDTLNNDTNPQQHTANPHHTHAPRSRARGVVDPPLR